MSNHLTIKQNITKGDILLSRNKKDPISKMIRGITKSNWSHSFIYVGNGKIIESDWNGVVVNPLDHYLNNKFKVGLFRITPPLSDKEKIKLIKYLRKKLGTRYGYLQLIWAFFLRVVGKSEDSDWAVDADSGVICSELIAEAYRSIGIKVKDIPPYQTEPCDYDDSPITVRIA